MGVSEAWAGWPLMVALWELLSVGVAACVAEFCLFAFWCVLRFVACSARGSFFLLYLILYVESSAV